MNTSKIAANIIEDIYTFNEKYEKTKNKFYCKKINETEYANSLFIMLCKCNYLLEVCNKLKEMGYKFTRYEKELCVLKDLIDNIGENLENINLEQLSMKDQFSLTTYLTKYEKILNVFEDVFEELKDHV